MTEPTFSWNQGPLLCTNDVYFQQSRRQKIENQLKTKKQEQAKLSREMGVIEKKMREREVEMNKKKPLYIKAKERTSHVIKRLEATKWVVRVGREL